MAEFVARAGTVDAADEPVRSRGSSFDVSVFGVLAPFVRADDVTDVFVNPSGAVWVDRGAGAEPVDGRGPGSGDAAHRCGRPARR
jgi:Flp pilus assembly CpaF family ATPase